jgi:hypothetical protein
MQIDENPGQKKRRDNRLSTISGAPLVKAKPKPARDFLNRKEVRAGFANTNQ